jgi:predicted nicotinamide N-methyase
VFFRGNGDIIGATKIDEKLLDEIRKNEAINAVRKEILEVNNITTENNQVDVQEVVVNDNDDSEIIDIFSKFEEEEI